MRVHKVIIFFLMLLIGAAHAQGITYNLGRTPTSDEIQMWDFAINPEGMELPEGNGSAKDGAPIYARKCIACHGNKAVGAAAPALAGRNTVVTNWPFATSLWDYINRAMPLNMEGSLSNNEVYALTAYLLFVGSVIDETYMLNRDNLPNVKMPNSAGYVQPPIDQWEPGMPRLFRIIDP
ncbi:MAG: c-type cytochrome [Gammaproteobacteria bacterium]